MMAKSSNAQSFSDALLSRSIEKNVPKTFKEERIDAENTAAEHEKGRQVQASLYPNAVSSSEVKQGSKTVMSNERTIVTNASKELRNHLASLVGKGGLEIELEEFRSKTAREDKVDASVINEAALMSFSCKFVVPSKEIHRTAKFIVTYDEKVDRKYTVANVFYGSDEKEFPLTTASLNDFLKAQESDAVKNVKAEKPIVWFNPEADTYEKVAIKEPSEKIAARLQSQGFNVDSNFYVDACYNTSEFGRVVYFVDVPLEKAADFKKIAVVTDEDWVNRGLEKSYKHKETEWPDRATEAGQNSSYKKRDFKGEDWANRTEQGDKTENPYGTEAKMLASDAMRKEAVKKALDDNKPETTLEKIARLEKLLS
jgi:hypothetical protein